MTLQCLTSGIVANIMMGGNTTIKGPDRNNLQVAGRRSRVRPD